MGIIAPELISSIGYLIRSRFTEVKIIERTIIDKEVVVPPLTVEKIAIHGERSNETCQISYIIEVKGDIHWILTSSGGELVYDSDNSLGHPLPCFWLKNETYFIYLDNTGKPPQEKVVKVKVIARYYIKRCSISTAILLDLWRIFILLQVPICLIRYNTDNKRDC